jgi:hypothetical protein
MASCVVIVNRLDDGRYRASCSVFPELEVIADSEDEARNGFEEMLEEYLRDPNECD